MRSRWYSQNRRLIIFSTKYICSPYLHRRLCNWDSASSNAHRHSRISYFGSKLAPSIDEPTTAYEDHETTISSRLTVKFVVKKITDSKAKGKPRKDQSKKNKSDGPARNQTAVAILEPVQDDEPPEPNYIDSWVDCRYESLFQPATQQQKRWAFGE